MFYQGAFRHLYTSCTIRRVGFLDKKRLSNDRVRDSDKSTIFMTTKRHNGISCKTTYVSVHFANVAQQRQLSLSHARSESFDSTEILLQKCIDHAMKNENDHESLLVSNVAIQRFCDHYTSSLQDEKRKIMLYMCNKYGVQHDKVKLTCATFTEAIDSGRKDATLLQAEARLRSQLQPLYSHLFKLIGRLDGGVKFITDLRFDAMRCAAQSDLSATNSSKLRDLASHLKSTLSIWFSVGLLKLTRITWETPADILEKIAKNEAVHQVRSWIDLKHRVGIDRRCYAFFHSSMPREPLLLLHVALTHEITKSITDIVNYSTAMADSKPDVSNKNTAIFYSITSTQLGLQGIEFGIHMIRAVVHEMQQSFPNLHQFSSLSPIPRFHGWLIGRILQAMKDKNYTNLLQYQEAEELKAYFEISDDQKLLEHLHHVLKQQSWMKDEAVSAALRCPLLRLCAEFLHSVKSRGYAFDPVANFHLRNGSVLWRINWMADPSVKGFNQSFGMMVNYRYYLEDMEENSRNYILQQHMSISPAVLDLKNGTTFNKANL